MQLAKFCGAGKISKVGGRNPYATGLMVGLESSEVCK